MSALRRTRAAALSAALTAGLVLGVTGTAPAAEGRHCYAPHRQPASACGAVVSRHPASADGIATTPPAAAPLGDENARPGCTAFATHADAQVALARGRADPALLDADADGIACEQHFGAEGQQVVVHPEGGLAAGRALRR